MALIGALRHQVDARLQHGLAAPLGEQGRFDGVQNFVVGHRQRVDIGAVQIGNGNFGHCAPALVVTASIPC